MKLTRIGSDVITVDESNYKDWCPDKIHIIKLKFESPTKEKIFEVFKNYKKTVRFIIDDNIRFYNYLLKDLNKKYYIMNVQGHSIVTFFKRNNKVVLNTYNLEEHEIYCLNYDGFLIDVLSNLEVIITSNAFYEDKQDIIRAWPGNLILSDGTDI